MSGVAEQPPQQCELLGGFGLLVQSILGVLCFLVLVFKRQIERPKRLWSIFLMDTAKQLVSAIMQHFLNVGLALLLSAHDNADQCEWYFITYMLDCTLGILINFGLLTLFERLFVKMGQRQFQTGNYYKITYPQITTYSLSSDDNKEPKKVKPKVEIEYGVYTFQLVLWSFIVSKIILYFFQLLTAQWLIDSANYLFEPIQDQPELELLIIMVIVPLIFNAFTFWVQDSFLKKNKFNKTEKNLVLDALYEKSAEPVEVEMEESVQSEPSIGIELQVTNNE